MEGKILMLKYNKKIKDKYRHFDVLLDNKEIEKDKDVLSIWTPEYHILKMEIMRDGTIWIAWFGNHFKIGKSKFDNSPLYETVEGLYEKEK